MALTTAWLQTRGIYYPSYPSSKWPWAFIIAGSWTIGAYVSLDNHKNGADLEEVPEGSLRLSEKKAKSAPVFPAIETVDARWHAVLGAYGAFLTDLIAIADLPLLADPSCPATDRFQRQLVIAEDAHALASRDPAKIPVYQDAVQELEKAWQEARSWAKRKGYSTLEPSEQAAVRRARTLLDVALSDTAYRPERRAAMHKAVELLRTVVDIPEQATTAIEHRVDRLELGR